MSLLHDYFNTGNLQLFQRLLESTGSDKSTGPSSSGARSWKKQNESGSTNVDVNGRDWLGRTVLHLASASIEHLGYVRALLRHPAINVNLPDTESHWTPLHRSLYNANFPAARLLLQRSEIDTSLKDCEGYTAFDLYNSTLNGTKPSPEEGDTVGDLLTWGANVNATLGHGDSNDRMYPEQVLFPHKDDVVGLEEQNLSTRFLPVRVKQVVMSKLHTVVITTESEGNLRVCGFGSGGRLGPSSHTQYSLKPLSQFSQTIVSVALGQDHTLGLTKSGEVLTWGLNRFSQLGYPVDPPIGGRTEEPIQYTPRKVQGPLRKEIVKGVAASKCASACWTEDSVYTWGTNNGQLGYDKVAQPVQVQPRKVSRLTSPVISITMTENAMACLMQNNQVECFYNDGYHRINFPTHAFPSPIHPYRPPQAVKDSRMAKITSCGDVFASLSYHGEVYIFSPTNSSASNPTIPSSNEAESSSRAGGPFKCQRVWALRKKSTAVKDVAIGPDGSIIICTESGHVFVRTRNLKSGTGGTGGGQSGSAAKAFKFQRVPFLQRVTKVFANASGGFGALRVDFGVKDVEVKGSAGTVVGGDIARVRPWVKVGVEDEDPRFAWMKDGQSLDESIAGYSSNSRSEGQDSDDEDAGVDTEDDAVKGDIRALKEMCDVIKREERMRKEGVKAEDRKLSHGADTLVHLPSGAVFPVHKVILAARSRALCKVISATTKKASSVFDEQRNIKISLLSPLHRPHPNPYHLTGPGSKELTQLSITGCHPLSVLILLDHIYSDNVVTVWDRRVSHAVEPYARTFKIKLDPTQIKNEVQALAKALELDQVLKVLERPVKFAPGQSMVGDLAQLFDSVNSSVSTKDGDGAEEVVARRGGGLDIPAALTPDVVLELEDKEVYTHSVILRSRSELFQSFFDEPEWTSKRWGTGVSSVMSESGGADGGQGGVIRVNLKHLRWHVMEYVLRFLCCGCDKEMFERLKFVENVDGLLEFMFDVMAAANELLLDRLVLICSAVILTYTNIHSACYILADATYFSATQLTDRIRSYVTANMELFLESHMLDDISEDLVIQLSRYAQDKQKEKAPFVRGGQLVEKAMKEWKAWLELQDFPEPFVRRNKPWKVKQDFLPLPKLGKSLRKLPSGDDLFTMDDADTSSPSASDNPQPVPGWKIYVPPKVDMKAVMAEEAAGQVRLGTTTNRPGELPRTPSKQRVSLSGLTMTAGSPHSSGSPWKTQSQQLRGDQTPRASPPAPPSFQLSITPQKQKEVPKVLGRTPSSGQPLPSTTPTKQPQSPALSATTSTGPVMGPTITPMRLPASSSKSVIVQRNTSGPSKAWVYTRPTDTLSPAVPVTQNTSLATVSGITFQKSADSTANAATTPPNPKSISFLAIQFSQQEEQLGDPSRDPKKSLLDIQEEEKARRQEEDFLRWWQEEEVKVKIETEALEAFRSGQGQGRGEGGSGKQRRGSRGGKDGGRTAGEAGRGRGGPKGRKEGKNTQAQQHSEDKIAQPQQRQDDPSQPHVAPPRPRHRKHNQPSEGPSQPASGTSQTPTSRPRPRKPSQKNPHQHQTSPPVPAQGS